MKKYELVNGVMAHERSPDTFEIPSRADRQSLEIGDLVKLGVSIPEDQREPGEMHTERMWVRVHTATDTGYTGNLSNHPVVVDMKYGDKVEFGSEHVLNLMVGGDAA